MPLRGKAARRAEHEPARFPEEAMALSDMFLKLESGRFGPVKGEVTDPEHFGEMAVQDWSWGMSNASAMGGGRASRTALSELRIVRLVDAASTALMTVMRANDPVKLAVLSVRKVSGAAPIDYFVLRIERGRITSYDVRSGGEMGLLLETLTLAFEKIDIDYHRQSAKGEKEGGSTFSADVGALR